MKVEHSLTASCDGTAAKFHSPAGAQAKVETLLTRIEAPGE